MEGFVYVSQPARVVFGAGSLGDLPREVELLGARRALILSTPGQVENAERIAMMLGARAVGVFAHAVMHVPVEVVRAAIAEVRRVKADCLVAIGGGSTTGLAKAIALDCSLPIVAVATTYAGSEMTPIYGVTADGVKRTGKDPRVQPRTVIYDPALTLSLPVQLSVTSGINAIAHAAEGLYAKDGNPIMSLVAEEGIRCLATALPAIRANPRNIEARAAALEGAWLCGTVLGNVGMALHHKLCHVLGGSFNLPHAEVHTVILPHAIQYNSQAVPAAMSRLARALSSERPARALFDLARDNDAPYALSTLGLERSALARAADLATQNPYWNPCPVQRDAIRELLQKAWEGTPPD